MTIKDQNETEQRLTWVDVLRFISIFMVICIHCSDPFNVSPEARSNPDFNFWGSLYGSFLRPCVPLFVMITGILLLPIKQSMEDFYKKRLLRIAVPFLLWSTLYNLFPWLTGLAGLPPSILSDTFAYASPTASQSFQDAMQQIFLIPVAFNAFTVPMWYMYMLIGLYLYMPIFSAWIEQATRSQKKIFLSIWVISLCLPYAYRFFSSSILGLSAWNSFGTFYYFAGFNGYLLLGHYLANDLQKIQKISKYILSLVLFTLGYSITFVGFKFMTANPNCTEEDMELFFLYCSPNVMLMTVALFLLIKDIKIKSPTRIQILASISKCGLGIYLIHYFVVGLGYALADILLIPVPIKIPVTAIVVFLFCWAFVALLYKMFPKASRWIVG